MVPLRNQTTPVWLFCYVLLVGFGVKAVMSLGLDWGNPKPSMNSREVRSLCCGQGAHIKESFGYIWKHRGSDIAKKWF
jgi:hypothetical protein